MFEKRIEKALSKFNEYKIDALLIYDRANTFYLSGFQGTHSVILLSPSGSLFTTDKRYIERTKKEIKHLRVRLERKSLYPLLLKQKVRNVGVEGNLPLNFFESLKKNLKGMRIKNVQGLLSDLRKVKDAGEIQKIRQAAKATDLVLKKTLPKIKEGASETQISRFIRRSIEDKAGGSEAFENIVAAGKNAAVPHALPGNRKIKNGDFVVVDLGARVGGYCSDLTRTFAVGKISTRKRKIYQAVLDAQMYVLEKVKPGVSCKRLSLIALNQLAKAGLSKYFIHSLGHGVGIEVHEPPHLSVKSEEALEEGNVITIEPGVYITGCCGVRIEDLVLVTADGCEVLSQFSKTL